MPQFTGCAKIYPGCVFPNTVGQGTLASLHLSRRNATDKHTPRPLGGGAGVITYRTLAA